MLGTLAERYSIDLASSIGMLGAVPELVVVQVAGESGHRGNKNVCRRSE